MRNHAIAPLVWCLAAAVAVMSLACSESEPAPAPSAEQQAEKPEPARPAAAKPTAQPADEPAQAGPAGDTVVDPSFELKLSATGPYKVGELSSFKVSLTPRGEYHINQDFPIEVKVSGPDPVTLPKASLQRTDAAEFGENVARFDVPFSAGSAGEHEVKCDVRFAVCTPETCVPDERTLALALPVQ